MATVIMQGGSVIVCYREYGDKGGFFILSRSPLISSSVEGERENG